MAIDFTLSGAQEALRAEARAFAHTVLSGVPDLLRPCTSAEERFAATRPAYEELVRRGFLRKLIPVPVGGDCMSLVDMAVIVEEFHAVDVNVSLTALATVLGLTPVILAGTPKQQRTLLAPFLLQSGAPLAAFAFSEPGGSANFAAPAPAESMRTVARRDGSQWRITGTKHWVSSASGWDKLGADLITVACRTSSTDGAENFSVFAAQPRGTRGFHHERTYETMGHRGHQTPRFRFDSLEVSGDARAVRSRSALRASMGSTPSANIFRQAAVGHGRSLTGGETGIRTPDRLLTYTRFPGVRLKPLIHLSENRGL